MLYSNYQAMVGFWYETWSGVEVRREGLPEIDRQGLKITKFSRRGHTGASSHSLLVFLLFFSEIQGRII